VVTPAPDVRICFVGDSFVAGTGDPDGHGWVSRVCRDARRRGVNVTGYNLGVRRDTSRDVAQRWRDECARRLPAPLDGRVVFSFGVNDTTIIDGARRIEIDESIANTNAIFAGARALYAVLMVGPPPVAEAEQNARIEALSARLAEAAATHGVRYLDTFATLRHSATWMREVAQNDGSHPQGAGYDELARLIARWPAWWFPDHAR
jgi:lysophospholipase L1-like esterase